MKQLFTFLKHRNIPLDEHGDILAYKSVRTDWMDHHSHTVSNKPGSVHEMPRNEISDDPNEACYAGFHVGALRYAETFHRSSSRIIVCKISPADVVCIPYDSSAEKMRVCKYVVIGLKGAELPSTTVSTKELEVPTAARKGTKQASKSKKTRHTKTKAADTKKFDAATKRKWAKMDSQDRADLRDYSIADLRKYATYHIHIVGASKIPGGKKALLDKVIRARRK